MMVCLVDNAQQLNVNTDSLADQLKGLPLSIQISCK